MLPATVVVAVPAAGVYEPVDVMLAPVKDASVATSLSVINLAPVPVNVCAAAVPLIVPELELPVNLSSAPVPVNAGADAL